MNKVKLERKNKADQKKIDAVLTRINKDFVEAKNDFFLCKALKEMKEIMEAEIYYWISEKVEISIDVDNDHSERLQLINTQLKELNEFVDKVKIELDSRLDNAYKIQAAMLNSYQLNKAIFIKPE